MLSGCQRAVFWDRKGVLMVEFIQQWTSIMSEAYYETLKNCKRKAIQNKRHGMLTSGIVLLYDYARLHYEYSCSHFSTAGAFKLGVL
jgi:hypothetical protein